MRVTVEGRDAPLPKRIASIDLILEERAKGVSKEEVVHSWVSQCMGTQDDEAGEARGDGA